MSLTLPSVSSTNSVLDSISDNDIWSIKVVWVVIVLIVVVVLVIVVLLVW